MLQIARAQSSGCHSHSISATTIKILIHFDQIILCDAALILQYKVLLLKFLLDLDHFGIVT